MDFKQAKKKAKRIRQERTLLLIYAIAVTAALLVSVFHNNNVNALVAYDEPLIDEMSEELALEESSFSLEDNLKPIEDENGHFEVIEPEEQTPELKSAEELISVKAMGVNEEAVVVEKGDNFIGILTKMGLEYAEATKIYNAYKKVYDARFVKAGQIINISSVVDSQYQDMVSITKVMTEPVSGTRYIVEKKSDGKYEERVEQDDLKT